MPTYIEPSLPQTWRSTPETKPSRKGKTAPWYTPSTFSRKTRKILLWPWSPTKSWPWKGPNLPPVESTRIPDVEMPMMPCGSHTAGSFNSGTCRATSCIGAPVFGTCSGRSRSGDCGSSVQRRPSGLPTKSPRSTCVIQPDATQSPWFSE
jgi:hypothetical protein